MSTIDVYKGYRTIGRALAHAGRTWTAQLQVVMVAGNREVFQPTEILPDRTFNNPLDAIHAARAHGRDMVESGQFRKPAAA